MKEFFHAVSNVFISSVYFRNKNGTETHSFQISIWTLVLDWEAQNWAQSCRCSITSAEVRTNITPHDLLAVEFLMQAKMCLVSYSASVY